MNIGSFKIPGHSTKREWAVYILLATPIEINDQKLIYIGKVGDNRAGCNPVISRVGNHFSFNKIHSQIRNWIFKNLQKDTIDYNYEYFYCHFGNYDLNEPNRIKARERINELERELNRLIQKKIDGSNYILMNPYKGGHVSKIEKEKRLTIINEEDIENLKKLIKETFSF